MVLVHRTPKMSEPMPQANIAATLSHSGAFTVTSTKQPEVMSVQVAAGTHLVCSAVLCRRTGLR